jgi:hypothetical protein
MRVKVVSTFVVVTLVYDSLEFRFLVIGVEYSVMIA